MGLEIAESQSVLGWWNVYDANGTCRFCGIVVPADGSTVYAVDANWYQPQILHAKSHGVG